MVLNPSGLWLQYCENTKVANLQNQLTLPRRLIRINRFEVGTRVVRSLETWKTNEFDSWGRGDGVGVVVEPPFTLAAHKVDIRWTSGSCFESTNQFLVASDASLAAEAGANAKPN